MPTTPAMPAHPGAKRQARGTARAFRGLVGTPFSATAPRPA